MTAPLPRVTARQVIRILERYGFGKRVTVPVHSGKILHPKVLKSILEDSGISVEAFTAEL